ncbi:hypothetical protein [Streptomyces lincolnensis]|uniref:hypothetical protein n=1 Tax=Streptomyces TaxID=1883 RepID=UPI001E57A983|nr:MULTISPECIES: hypothetical protein [Streptomyces]MCD7437851.1 hypothetical protein [Streptomyces lincolnensis]WLW55971.1 hypothetical protein QU709_33550 [Streptomyces coralus]
MTDHGDGRTVEMALAAGLGALTAFQGYVQEADAKINSMLVAHTGGVVAVVTTLGAPGGQRFGTVGRIVLAAFACAFLVSGFHLGRAMRPRLHTPLPRSPFGFMGLDIPPATDPRKLCAQLWDMARLLGCIAHAKNRHLTRAMPWTGLMLCLGVAVSVLGVG